MNSRQEKFAREIVAGKSQADAYREAFPKSRNWKPETLHKRASELAQNGEVSGRVAELRREADAAAIMDCRELRTRLTAKLREAFDGGGSVADICALSNTLARVSGMLTPAALAIVAPRETLEDEMRRFNEWSGTPAAKAIRSRRIREALGFPEPEESGLAP